MNLEPGAHNIITPGEPGFSRIVTGPVESATPGQLIDVHGAIYIPLVRDTEQVGFRTVYATELFQVGYAGQFPVELWQTHRALIEAQFRQAIANELVKLVPVNMHAELA